MLDENSYLMALYLWGGAAGVLILYVGWWLSRHWRPAWVALAVLLLAALLLTPAYPAAGVETMAPALIVAVFQVMTEGVVSAGHALRPLAFMSATAVVIALLLGLTLLRQRRAAKSPPRRSAGGNKSRGRA